MLLAVMGWGYSELGALVMYRLPSGETDVRSHCLSHSRRTLLLRASWLGGLKKTWHNRVQGMRRKWVAGDEPNNQRDCTRRVYTERKKDGEKTLSRSGIT